MSKHTKKLSNKNYLLKVPRVSTDDQSNPLPGRWNNQQHMADIDARNLVNEIKKLGMQTASDVIAAAKIWTFPNWLQQSELTLLVGAPGDGKTAFECKLAAGVTRGKNYSFAQDLTANGSGHVIIINREDNIATSLKPRLGAADADLTKVHFIGCKSGSGNDSAFSFFNEQDLLRLEGQAKLLDNNLALIILDPIYYAVDGDANNNFKAREAYEGLAQLAKRLSCAILGIAHTVKNTRNKAPLARVAGPPALREVPRAIMLLSKIANGPTASGGTHVLVHAKNNEGTSDGGFEYRIKTVEIPETSGAKEATIFDVTDELYGSAEEILNLADGGVPTKSISKLDSAVFFLREVLKDGPRLWLDIEELAKQAGVSKGTLLNAKALLKIVTEKRKGDGRSVWLLVDQLCEKAEGLVDEGSEDDEFDTDNKVGQVESGRLMP